MEKNFNFTRAFSMRCDAEQFPTVKKEMENMGYKIGYPLNFRKYPYIANNYDNKMGMVCDIEVDMAYKYNRICIETFNRDLCLALAAMTDKPDGIVGEWFIYVEQTDGFFTQNKLYKKLKDGVCDTFADDEERGHGMGKDGIKQWFRKATADELIKHFAEEKPFILPEKWYCPYENREQFEIMKKHFGKEWNYNNPDGFRGCSNNTLNNNWNCSFYPKNRTKITFDQFMKHVVGQHENKPEQKQPKSETDPQIESLQKRIEELERNVKKLTEANQPEPQPASRFADKQPLRAWDNNWSTARNEVFWDEKNEKSFNIYGNRNGFTYDNYEPIPADQIPAWMIEAAKYLKD